jgi:hypothetical protein
MWIRELKEPLIPKSLYNEFIDIKRNLSDIKITSIFEIHELTSVKTESEKFSEDALKPIRALFNKLEIDNQVSPVYTY